MRMFAINFTILYFSILFGDFCVQILVLNSLYFPLKDCFQNCIIEKLITKTLSIFFPPRNYKPIFQRRLIYISIKCTFFPTMEFKYPRKNTLFFSGVLVHRVDGLREIPRHARLEKSIIIPVFLYSKSGHDFGRTFP